MHDDRFDTLAREVWSSQTRRRLIGRLAVLPILSAIVAGGQGGNETAAAEHPVHRIHRRQARRRQRKTHHSRGNAPKAGGDGDDECQARRKRGDHCEETCQCQGDYRCGAPRLPVERNECGQAEDATKVCCLGQGDDCTGNDCACCGRMICQKGHCRSGGCKTDRDCARGTGQACVEGRCITHCFHSDEGPRCSADARGCTCSSPAIGFFCIDANASYHCDERDSLCTSNDDCPFDMYCLPVECYGQVELRCQALCPV